MPFNLAVTIVPPMPSMSSMNVVPDMMTMASVPVDSAIPVIVMPLVMLFMMRVNAMDRALVIAGPHPLMRHVRDTHAVMIVVIPSHRTNHVAAHMHVRMLVLRRKIHAHAIGPCLSRRSPQQSRYHQRAQHRSLVDDGIHLISPLFYAFPGDPAMPLPSKPDGFRPNIFNEPENPMSRKQWIPPSHFRYDPPMPKTIDRGDAKIVVEDRGQGTPVVFCHGFGLSRRSMIPLAGALGEKRRTILIDWRGHGDTRCPLNEDAYSFPILRDDLRHVLKEILDEPADLVGHSMGGQVALMLALAAPECVRSLTVLGAGPLRQVTGQREGDSWKRSAAYLEKQDHQHVERMLWSATELGDPEAAEKELDWIYAGARGPELARMIRGAFLTVEDNQDECKSMSRPLLIITGEMDSNWLEASRKLHGLVPGSTLRVVPLAGHMVHLEAQDEVVEAIRNFWNTIDENDVATPDQKKTSESPKRT